MSFESSLYFQEEIYIWEKNIHIYNEMQIYIYTQYILKKKNSWQVIWLSIFCNFNRMIHLSPRFQHTTLWLTYFSESLFHWQEEKAQSVTVVSNPSPSLH